MTMEKVKNAGSSFSNVFESFLQGRLNSELFCTEIKYSEKEEILNLEPFKSL